MTFDVEVTKLESNGDFITFEARTVVMSDWWDTGTFVGRCQKADAPRLGDRFRLVLVESELSESSGFVTTVSPRVTTRITAGQGLVTSRLV